ncbi:iron dicitrate transport regulator FecR, partial [Pseudomonas sp. FW305-130]
FNIRLQPTALDIVVMRGEATAPRFAGETMTRDADTDVVAGRFERLLLMRATSDVQSASPEAVSAAIAWQQGEIVFDNEPLHAAVEEYNRYL